MERKRSSRRSNYRYQPRKQTTATRCKTCCRKFTAFMFSHVGLCALVVGYAVMGAFAFRALEAPKEQQDAHKVREKREQVVQKLWDITNELNILYRDNWTQRVAHEISLFQRDVIKAVKDGYDGDEQTGTQWSFSSAFLYSLTVITTIGYGNIAPRTDEGRAVTIVYAIIGIPLMLLYLTNIGDVLAKMFKYVYGRICKCCSFHDTARQRRQTENYRAHHIIAQNSPNKQNAVVDAVCNKDKLRVPPEDEVRIEAIPDAAALDDDDYEKPHVTVPITLCLTILVLYICGGGLLFSSWEEWTFLDGSYFCFVTLTTIGFGDLVPGKSITDDSAPSHERKDDQGKLVLCSLYVLVGMALIAMCFNLMQEEVIHKVRACGARIGIIKDRDDEDD